MDSLNSNIGRDPRYSVLPPKSIQNQHQHQQHSHSRDMSGNVGDVLRKRYDNHSYREEEEKTKFDQERAERRKEWIENFDRDTPKLRAELLKELGRERDAIVTDFLKECEMALKINQPTRTTDPLFSIAAASGAPTDFLSANKTAPPLNPATQAGPALNNASADTPRLRNANPSGIPVDRRQNYSSGLLERNMPLTGATAPLASFSSAIATEPQSGIKEVRNETANKVGDYVYSTGDQIGVGSSARVYKCLNIIDRQNYAIREISTHPRNPRQTHESIMEEVALMKKLHHPNVITLYEVLRTQNPPTWYMVLELCDSELIERDNENGSLKNFTEDECRDYFQQLLLGVEYLHGHNILHRDIKPGNLLINKDKVLRISDFGLSRTLAGGDGMMTRTSRGTLEFMAPEIFDNLEDGLPKYKGAPTDIWSMGVTLFFMWNGKIPFPAPNNRTRPNYKHPLEFKVGTPKQLKELLSMMLELDSDKRITMDRLRRDPWVIDHGRKSLSKSREENVGSRIDVTDEDRAKSLREIALMELVASKFKSFKRNKRAEASTAEQTGEADEEASYEYNTCDFHGEKC